MWFLFLVAIPAFCEEPHTLEKIIVKASDSVSSEVDAIKGASSVQIITSQEIRQANPNSLGDLLDYIAGIDLRNRGSFGVQADLSLRGSGFEQVAVLIDGINVMDPQTGHHNLDIPLTLFDVERVEVTKVGDSAFYGAGALSGSVNIITKKPFKKNLNMDTLFGEHALFGEAFSFSLPKGDFSSRLSFDHKLSKAARPNTDFEYRTASLYLNKDFGQNSLNTLFGYQKKDFGADSFYSNLFPEEEEHTETFFAQTGLDSKLGSGKMQNNLFFRKHRDKFILRRNNPTSVNYHTTYTYGFNTGLDLSLEYGHLLLGIDAAREEINSTNLGKHSRLHESGSLGFIPQLKDKFTLDLRLRQDHYEQFGWQPSYNFGLGYKIFGDNLRLKSCFSRAFRVPTFTELFYSDAANKGNPNLGVERADNYLLGLEFRHNWLELGLDGFLRRGRNLIDWTRTLETLPWSATNLGSVDFSGIEFNSKIKLDSNSKFLKLEKIVFSYNYTTVNKKTSGLFSKYVLDILKHQLMLGVYSYLFGLNLDWQLSYNKREYGQSYFIGNLYIGKKLGGGNFTVEPFVKIDNFSNTRYTEVSGVLQPGRWLKSGLKLEW